MRKCKAMMWDQSKKVPVEGVFHRWASQYEDCGDAGVANYTVALIELDDGRIVEGIPDTVEFTDEDSCMVKGVTNTVTVRWFDSYLEEFEATEVRFGSDILFLRLVDGKNRHIPLRNVRWFGMSVESHQREAQK